MRYLDIGKNGIIIIAACIIAVALVAVGMVMYDSDDSSQEVDITGQWHAVDIELIYMDDSITNHDLSEDMIAAYDVYIYDNRDGVVNGFFYQSLFVGAYSEGVVISDMIDPYTGAEYHVMAFISDPNAMQLVVNVENIDGSTSYALTGSYTKDRSTQELINAPNIMGNWNCNYGKWADPDSINVIGEKGTLTITAQDHSVFAGDLEQIIDQQMVKTHLVGGFTRGIASGYMIGAAIDDEGYLWNVYCKDGVLVLNTCTETDAFSGTNEIVSSLRIYSRDMNVPTLHAPVNLQGTSWNGYYSQTLDVNGVYKEVGILCTIDFTLQEDTIVRGTLTTGSDVCSIVGAIYSSDPLAINVITDNAKFKVGKIVMQNENQFTFMTDGVEAPATSSVIAFDKMSNEIKYDIVGHWYNTYFYGYDEYGNYITISDYPALMHLYELSVYGVSGNTFYGFFKNGNISGLYYNNAISFRCESSEGYLQFDGTLMSSNYLVVTLKYFVFAEGETHNRSSVWSGFFSKLVLDEAEISNYDVDLQGSWKSISKFSFGSEQSYPLSGDNLTITKFTDNVFVGVMEQTNSDKQIVNREIKGVIETYEIDSKGKSVVYGTFADEIGVFWTFVLYDNDYLILHGALKSEVAQPNKLVSTERAFTRDGTGEIPDMDNVDILGTEWIMTSRQVMMPSGEVDDSFIDYRIGFTRAEGTLFAGWSHFGDDVGGQIAGYLIDNKIYLSSMYGTIDAAPDSGYGWIEGNTMTLIEFYVTEDGWCTSVAEFEKRILS